ncbi:MAG: hypothetical protein IJH39_08000, partial [Clostridia bacterium]|nr:hypothetical protein [Clostridia bacterium]
MKDKNLRVLKFKFITSLLAILVLVGVIINYFVAGNKSIVSKMTTKVGVVETTEEPEIAETHTVYMLVNELHVDDDSSLNGGEIKLTSKTEGLTVSAYSVESNTEITQNEAGNIVVPEKGLKLKVEGIRANNSYEFEIENAKVGENYVSTFKKSVIKIDASSEGSIEGYVKEITSIVDGEETTTDGSKEKTAIFMYEDNNNRIKINGNADAKIYYIKSANIDGLTQEEIAEKEEADWTLYDNEEGIVAENNCVIYAKSKYKTGEYSEITEITVNNIDKLAPNINVTTQTEEAEYETSVEVEITESENKLYGASGIVAYAMTEKEEEPEEYTQIEAVNEVEKQIEEIAKNGTYYIWAKDKAGNVNHVSFEVSNIKVKVVAIILESPVTELIGTEYTTLSELMSTINEKGLTKNSEKTLVQIVNDVRDETVRINNKNIEIDLNGYTIGSKNKNGSTVNLVNSNVTVVDNKYSISEKIEDNELVESLESKYSSKVIEGIRQYGKIYSKNYNAVEISSDSTFILGEDDRNVSVVTPIIESESAEAINNSGVQNNTGIFSYYDGILIGKTTTNGKTIIEGEVVDKAITNTPLAYDPATSLIEGEERFKTVLARISGIEAVIGRTRYTTLEQAIEAANNIKGTPADQIEIDIVTDITRSASIEVNNTKNIKLDLNNYTITSTATNYIFKNYGKMEIIDNSEEGTGKIESSTYGIIENEEGAELTLTSGKIVVNKNGGSNNFLNAIKNLGSLKTTGGEIELLGTYNIGILNDGNGDSIINNLNIVGKANSQRAIQNSSNKQNGSTEDDERVIINNANILLENSNSYGINNSGSCTMIVNNSDITAKSSSSYPVVNWNTGNITVNNSNIKTLSGSSHAIYNSSTGNIVVNGGETTTSGNSSYCIYNNAQGKINILNNANLTASSGYSVYNVSGIVEIRSATLKTLSNWSALRNDTGTVNIFEVEIISNGEGIYNYSTGTINLKKDNDKQINITAQKNGILNSNSGNINIENATISGQNNGIQNAATGNVNITNGDIIGNSDAIANLSTGNIEILEGNVTSTTGSGIYNKSTGRVTIGKQDGNVNFVPTIIGEGYGIYIDNVNASVNFYDGELKGKTEAIGGVIQNIENGYDIILSDEEGYEIARLGHQEKVAYVGEDETNTYNSLESAIIACSQENKITLLKKIAIIKEVGVEIPENAKITLDLNGKDLRVYNKEPGININGELTITDESDEESGIISGYGKSIIENKENKILNIEKGTIISKQRNYDSNVHLVTIVNKGTLTTEGKLIKQSLTNSGYGYVIDNSKTVTISGGDIEYYEGYGYGINNKEEGTVEITGGKVTIYNSYAKGIGNVGTGTVEINGGTVETKKGDSNAIENLSSGTVKLISGSIITNSNGGQAYSYGIKNFANGKVEVTGGSISVNNSYCIYNITGEVTINGGTLKSYNIGINNNSTGTIKVSGGSVSGSYKGIYNEANGSIEVTGGTISQGSYSSYYNAGISNISGVVKVTGGTITGVIYAIRNETGTITVGSKDGNVIYTPIIIGNSGGINNINGTLYFYDGIIKSVVNKSVLGNITQIEEGYSKKVYKNGENENYDIGSGNEVSVLEVVPVAKVESTGDTTYPTLAEAVNVAQATDKITILDSITITEDNDSIVFDKNITLDLNGYTINVGNQDAIINNNNLSIIDGSDGQNGKIVSKKIGASDNINVLIKNNGTLNVQSGSIQTLENYSYNIDNTGIVNITGGTVISNGTGSIIINSNGEVNISGGTVENTGGYNISDIAIKNYNSGIVRMTDGVINGNNYYSTGIVNNDEGTVEMSGGTIGEKRPRFGIKNTGSGSVTITGGNVYSSNYGSGESIDISNTGTGTVTIKGGKISTTYEYSRAIYNEENGTIIIEDVELIYGQYGIENIGTVRIDKGTIDAYMTAIWNRNTGSITINNGTISSNLVETIENNNNGSVEIKGGTIISNKEEAISNNNSAEIIMTGGTINATKTGIINNETGSVTVTGGEITSNTEIGINNISTGTITIGEKNNNVIDTPIITAEYALRNENKDGKLYYYDGTLKGKQETIIGIVNEIEQNKEVVLNYDETYEIATLGVAENVAYVGDDETNTYDNLESAISACGEEGKITLLKNIMIVTGTEVSTSENGKITLNLNSKTIKTRAYENAITNNGELIIKDPLVENPGKIIGYGNNIIKNEVGNNLTIEDVEVKLKLISGNSSNYLNCITNNGNLNINSGTIKTTNSCSNAIINNGIINMTDGSIITENTNTYAKAIGIRNIEAGRVTITGGTITTRNDESYGIYNIASEGTINFGGTGCITGNRAYAIYNVSGKLEVTGGILNTSDYTSIRNDNGIVDVYGGEINSGRYDGIVNAGNGTVNLKADNNNSIVINANESGISNSNNGTVNVETGEIVGNRYGIYSYSRGTVNITGGTITGATGVLNSKNITIKNATITGTNGNGLNNSGIANVISGKIESTTSIGIYNSGTLTLGENDSNAPSLTNPEIIGKTYGLQNANTFKFYDGIIKGETSAIAGTVSDTPVILGTDDKYVVTYPSGSETEAVLGIETTVENTIEYNGEYIPSLQQAIQMIANSTGKTGTIKINADVILTGTATIPSNATVTLILHGQRLGYKGEGATIVNNGTLIVNDYEDANEWEASECSVIESEQGVAIENNGTLTIGQSGNANPNSPLIKGTTAIAGTNGTTTNYTKLSGTIENTNSGVGTRTLRKINGKSQQYATGDGTGNGEKLVLSTEPEMKADSKLPTWVNTNVKVTADTDVIPVLKLYSEDKIYTSNYTIEYYYEGTKEKEEKIENIAIGETVELTDIESKIEENTREGYKLQEDGIKILNAEGEEEDLPLTIVEDASKNIIRVYYEEETEEISYTVEYYQENEKVDEDIETATVKLSEPHILTVDKSKINTTNKCGDGYHFVRTEPVTIPDTIANGGVIKVYYEENTEEISYTVEYYKENEKVAEDIETATVKLSEPHILTVDKSKINTTNKCGDGYHFVRTDPATIPDTIANGGVIKV